MPAKRPVQVAPAKAGTSTSKQEDNDEGGMGVVGCLMVGVSYLLFILFFPLSLSITLKVVQEYERLVIFRLGRLLSSNGKGPGLVLVLPCVDEFRLMDLRTKSSDIPRQKVLTKDSMTIEIDGVVFSRVHKVTRSLSMTTNPHYHVALRASTALRKLVGQKTLQELLSERQLFTTNMKNTVERSIRGWGVKIEKIDLKEIKMPADMQRAMATVAETERKAKARVIAAEGEMKASHVLRDAADAMSTPTAVNLRCLQTMLNVSKKNCSTVILPIPSNILQHFMKKEK